MSKRWWHRAQDEAPKEEQPKEEAPPVQLVHPFYLATGMSMAFAAAVSGGVALQREDTRRDSYESEALKNIQGNVRAFDLISLGAGKQAKRAESAESESRYVRQHTEASMFISLYDELKRTGQIRDLSIDTIEPGELVAITLGPAVAPLRRTLEQVMRLFEVAAPVTGMVLHEKTEDDLRDGEKMTRQRRRHPERERPAADEDDDSTDLKNILSMFQAIHEDLDESGMIDVVVIREDEPSVVLSLDKRFASGRVLELLHTSKFTVVGKVTEVWPTDEDGVNLYRRSVMSLLPGLT